MKVFYEISATLVAPDLLEEIPEQLQGVEVFHRRNDYTFRFTKQQFSLIPLCRDWLRGIAVEVTERGGRVSSKQDSMTAPLGLFEAGYWEDVELLSPPVVYREKCQSCGTKRKRLVENPSMTIKLPSRAKFPFFECMAADVNVMSAAVVEMLRAARLDTGLRTFPVQVEGDKSADYVGVYADVDLGWPAAPFGSYSDICDSCGATFPRYNFYPVYRRPDKVAHWMWDQLFGPTSVHITKYVTRFLIKDLEPYSGRVRFDPNAVPQGWYRFDPSVSAEGWYPYEEKQAFLPKKYHG